MTPQEFIKKWKPVALNERQTAQEHFLDLCRVFGHATPAEMDPSGESFSFEKGLIKTGGGGGYADVWKRGFFAWEYKKKKRDLDAALEQLTRYAAALENPPIHVVCDTVRFRIETRWTSSVVDKYEFELEDLWEKENFAVLNAVFNDPETLRPKKTRAILTREAADKFQAISDALQHRHPDREAVAHFVNQLVFCFFADSVKLLPDGLLRKLLKTCDKRPKQSKQYFDKLFEQMENGGEFDLTDIFHFNGGLFDGRRALQLEHADIGLLFAATTVNWALIDPTIFGTLFERFLDPDKRAQIGAHYTDEAKIMLVIEPVILRPLRAEWADIKMQIKALMQPVLAAAGPGGTGRRGRDRKMEEARAKAQALRDGFIDRLCALRILDPACGSGNFLYLALQAIKDIEYTAILECGALDLAHVLPRVGPEILHGIEINPFAAELARTTIWIGDIQWRIRNGILHHPEPILRKLDTIECRDALLTAAPSSAPSGAPSPAGGEGDSSAPFQRPPSPPAFEAARRADEGHIPPAKQAALRHYAKTMRAQPTPAEDALWKLLRDRRFAGFKFRRQVPLGDYIADFMCFSHRLIVEADGSQHGESASDPVRDAWFVSQGFRVRRFWNHDILRERASVMDTLWADLNETNPSSAPRGAPSPAGGEGKDVPGLSPSPPAFEAARRADEGVAPHYVEAQWPEADFIVGNPPFLGGKLLRRGLGDETVERLFAVYAGKVPAEADLVCYWFYKAWAAVEAGRATSAGLVATNSIRGGANRRVLEPVAAKGGIFEAWSDLPWTVDGAAVRVSVVCMGAVEPASCAQLDGEMISQIGPRLEPASKGDDLNALAENTGIAFIGSQKNGPFDISGKVARGLLSDPLNVNKRPNSDVVRPWANGSRLMRLDSDIWIIDFGAEIMAAQAALYETPFAHVLENVRPTRVNLRRDGHRTKWWIHGEARPGLRSALTPLWRFIATPRVAKHRVFVWLDKSILPDSRLCVVARDDDTTFGILHSRFHEAWTLATCSWHGVGNDPTYNSQSCFETFPFPQGLTPNIPAATYADDPRAQKIAAAAVRLDTLRKNWLNPPDLVDIVPEITPTAAPGEAPVKYPDRILPKNAEAAVKLKERTLTNLYNKCPQWLSDTHDALDRAVASAYGWPENISTENALAKLLALNLERAAR